MNAPRFAIQTRSTGPVSRRSPPTWGTLEKPMRLLLVTACLAALTCATATAASTGRIASRCSASGDSCYGIFKDRGNVIRFQLTLAAKYYNRYRICVKPPPGSLQPGTTCRSFPVKKTGSLYGGAVRWRPNFPGHGSGRYRVTWTPGARPVGPGVSLSFVAP